ncbi:hypothetical protein N825_07970 [Skermanella stibiiresistens SB22]|uniref:Uncharacterized protein n=1 Tax=Skermanella stibiiresistens SB22 TaxID=1385369 RepID=W9H3D0_9PROT|nr:hypothetical protein N825_07970 [Skermanella stibiiresistens SB22]
MEIAMVEPRNFLSEETMRKLEENPLVQHYDFDEWLRLLRQKGCTQQIAQLRDGLLLHHENCEGVRISKI